MKRKKIITDQDYADFRIANIVDVIKSEQHKMLRLMNGRILDLFWSIGGLLNDALYEKKPAISQLIRQRLAAKLIPEYGAYFSAENLSVMQDFSATCSLEKLQAIKEKVSWKYIRVLNQLQDQNAWIHYILLIYKKSLNPDQLQEIIDKDTPTFKDRAEQDLHYLWVDHKDLHHRMIMDVDQFFKGNGSTDFRRLLEPKERVFYDGLNDELEVELLAKTQECIYYFQSFCYDITQTRINYAFQYIGQEMSNAIVAIATTIMQDDMVNKVIAELNNRYLDKAWLLDCLKFGKAYENDFADFLHFVSFAHIKVLLSVTDKLERQGYATVAYEKKLTPEQLAAYIEANKLKPETVIEIASEAAKKNDKVTLKNGNRMVLMTTHVVELPLDREAKNSWNIFTDPDIMAFLRDA
ncbi:DUF1016 N-terminal domain-containing protein [Pedobacter sp. ASV28]|uniref:DUF1016 N-terminal domain-containing protein n=1 Tax=Pedobacter sp. ASV28 TaxID=2795123 RepID=UPI0018EA9155|nr:DUF1016 N-terminal domain-containing protein [Pedobacter sp. ASV28]